MQLFRKKRIIASTLHKQIIRRELQKESLGEELRILYVALTRAKEKLFITGCVGKMEKLMHVLYRFRDSGTPFLPVDVRMKGKTCWSYILPALAQHPAMDPLFEEYGMPAGCNTLLYRTKTPFLIKKDNGKGSYRRGSDPSGTGTDGGRDSSQLG
ncbi:MAG: 3'-5' exonuclease [Blautia sp.]